MSHVLVCRVLWYNAISGILDHPLEERNTIEMQAIVALAHLQCSVLFFIDISEQCGYTVDQQCSLFRSIQPLFANKQLIIVVNKVDQQPWETLDAEKKELVQSLSVTANCSLLTMSNISEHGVSEVKTVACEKLLANRVDARVSGKKIDHVMNRLQVFEPKPRDTVQRPAYIPESVQRAREEGREKSIPSRVGYAPTIHDVDSGGDIDMERPEVKKLARELMWLNGGPGVYSMDYRDVYDLKDDSWKWDAIPEIIDGKNIADFVDPEILSKLEALEKEEEQIVAELEASRMEEEIESDLESEEEAAVEAIRERKKKIKIMKLAQQTQNKPMMPHAIRGKSKDKHDPGALSTKVIKKTLDALGVDSSKMLERGRQMDERERGRKRERSLSRCLEQESGGDDDVDMEDTSSNTKAKKFKKVSATAIIGRARSHSRPRTPSEMGLKDESSVKIAKKLEREGRRAWIGAAGEGDNRKSVHLVKWMNTGKRRGQKTSTIGR
jgi:nucleolar GTP-binding protein